MKTKRNDAAEQVSEIYTDSSSPFYVPEKLRSAWAEFAAEAPMTDRLRVARSLAEQYAFAALPKVQLKGEAAHLASRSGRSDVVTQRLSLAEVDRFFDENLEDMLNQAEHALRLRYVAELLEHKRVEAEKAEAFAQACTCNVCGEVGRSHPGSRIITPIPLEGFGRRIVFRSCEKCYVLALQILAERARSGRDRAAAVEAELRSIGEIE